jgi:fructose-1,6-bisphosphatase
MNVINPEGSFTVSYDPIDGNCVFDVNMSVCSVFGVWHSKEINGLKGKDLVGAVCTVYGSRTSLVWYNPQAKKVEELTLLETKGEERWVVTMPNIKIKEGKASLFSPGLRSCYDKPELLDIFKQYC